MVSGCQRSAVIVTEKPPSQDSKLISNVESEDVSGVRQALHAGVNADAPDQSGRTPLMIAALKGNREIVTILLDAGANPNASDSVGETSLMKAIESGNDDLLDLLLDRGANIAAKTRHSGMTALHLAANQVDVTALKVLLNRNPDLNLGDSNGNTALMHAAADFSEAVPVLLAKGADVNAKNAAGATALMFAVTSQRNIKLLLDHGADINARDNDGWSVLQAAWLDGCPATIDLLIKAGAKE
jgi:ankyrin repeat protein